MPFQFQREPTEPGQWYISDMGTAKRGPVSPSNPIEAQPHRKDSRIRGPFDTEGDAKLEREALIAADPNLKANTLHIWQA